MNAERLLLLADFLETKVPAERFDYSWVFSPRGERHDRKTPLHLCGASGCALGWAPSVPELAAAGFVVQRMAGRSFDIAADVFDLGEREVGYLFDPANNDLPEDASPTSVAAHIRAFVARGGMP